MEELVCFKVFWSYPIWVINCDNYSIQGPQSFFRSGWVCILEFLEDLPFAGVPSEADLHFTTVNRWMARSIVAKAMLSAVKANS